MKKIAVVGAGISGVVCASHLREKGFNVCLIDKSRGVSGRSTTKRWPTIDNGIDMGAPYLKHTEISATIEPLIVNLKKCGVITNWKNITEVNGRIEKFNTYVGIPKMSSIARHLSTSIQMISTEKIQNIKKVINKWVLRSDSSEFTGFDCIVFAIPSTQLNDIIGLPSDLQNRLIHNQSYKAINTLLIETNEPLWNTDKNEVTLHNSLLKTIIADYKKPNRDPNKFSYTIHSDDEWATKTFDELSKEDVTNSMLDEFKGVFNVSDSDIIDFLIHRWRYAIPDSKNSGFVDGYFKSEDDSSIIVCGDWCNKPNFAGAMESGLRAASAVI
ncbi:MAG: FAD-dependent oxidoreductase [Candidatus Margulisiibacteriota bacterium]|nr:FAD-dependent oxidoreductase [Candidatus Margulisiibacteriota bacterium]